MSDVLLIWTHTHFCNSQRRETERDMQGEQALLSSFVFVFFYHLCEEFFAGFSSPRGFPKINLCLYCDCVSFSDHVYAIVVKLN